MSDRVTRLAPSPTGSLHLGNLRTFLINWATARQRGWRVAMRVEDLDSPRVKAETVAETLDLLRWMGLDWDGEILTQTADLAPYRAAMAILAAGGFVFSCDLSRREIDLAASAPQEGAVPSPYPKSLRPGRAETSRWRFDGEGRINYRFAVDSQSVTIEDRIAGTVVIDPQAETGDVVVWTKRGVPAYQLAVVVDDLRQGVTDVVRGDDLLPSAAIQSLIYRALDAQPPTWWHVGLVVGEDGKRLAKRHGDTRAASYRAAGVRAERIVGLIAKWCGLTDAREEISAAEFRLSFDIEALHAGPIVFTEQDHAWVLSGTSPSSSSPRR